MFSNPNPNANLNSTLNPNASSNPRSITFCEGTNTNFIRRRSEEANSRSEGANSKSINFLS